MEIPHDPPHILSPKVHWERARGYFQLHMYSEAESELVAIPDENPWTKKKRTLSMRIRQEVEDWHEMMEIARGLRLEYPEEEEFWVCDAYATRRADSIEKARNILLDALLVKNNSGIIRYNLACYACQLNSPGECLDFLKEAVRRDAKYRLMAIEDEDLEPVREALLKMGWGRAIA